MLILLIVLAVILAVLAIVLTAHVRLEVDYGSNGPSVTVRFLFFSYRIVGGKKKRIKKKDFKIGRFRRRKKRVMKKYRVKNAEKKPKKKREGAQSDSRSVRQRIEDVYFSFEEVLKAFPKALKIHCKRLIIAVGGKDAHDMAINYGYVVQGVQYAISALKAYTELYTDKNSKVSVYPAFNDGKWRADVDIDVKIRTAYGIRLAWLALKGYLKYRKKNKRSSAPNNAEATA